MSSDLLKNDDLQNNFRDKRSIQIFVLSGGVGASGEQLVRTVMAQFPDADIQVKVFPKLSNQNQIGQIIENASAAGAIVAHTFVDPELRRIVKQISEDEDLVAMDLIGPLMEVLAEKLDQVPLGKPGLYRNCINHILIASVPWTMVWITMMAKNQGGWPDAEIVLLGASRVGKTPISLYLVCDGLESCQYPTWSAGIPLREGLLTLDRRTSRWFDDCPLGIDSTSETSPKSIRGWWKILGLC